MALQTFTSGQVLTAAQVNALQANDYNQTVSQKTTSYVLVAADKGTRVEMNAAGSTTITVNTALFSAGDTLFIQNIGAGTTTVTAGTATVSGATLAVTQYQGGTLYFTSAGVSIFFPTVATSGASGLTFITSSTFSAVSSVSVNSCFSATYTNYQVILNQTTQSATENVNLRMRVGGVDASSNDYYNTTLGLRSDGTGANISGQATSGTINQGTSGLGARNGTVIDLLGPFAASGIVNVMGLSNGTSGNFTSYKVGFGVALGTTAFDGFTIFPVSGTFGGTVRVYGYRNS